MYLSDHSKNLISAEEKVAELIKQREQLRNELAAERAKVKMLGIALQSLVDEQNDAPLERRRGHWQMAMDDAGLALATAAAALPDTMNPLSHDFARTLERELHESRNAERLARVQLGNERARLDDLICVNATGAARLAHAKVQLAAEREKLSTLREACGHISYIPRIQSALDKTAPAPGALT